MWLATNVSVKPFPWFHHSCIASITSCLLCSSACSAGKLLLWSHTRHTLTVPCQDPLGRAQQVQFGNRMAPSAPSSSCLWQRGPWGALRAALLSWAQGEPSAAALLPPDPQGRAAAHGDKEPVLPRAWSQSLCEEQPRALEPWELIHCHTSWATYCNRQGKNFDSSEMGLYGVYCSKHFIILQWDVLRSAKYYCKIKLRLFFFF